MKIRQSEKMKGFTRKERETLDENQTIRKNERVSLERKEKHWMKIRQSEKMKGFH